MAGEPILAHGASVNHNFIPVANRLDISFKPPQKEKVDITSHGSTSRGYLKGFGDGGEVSFQLLYHPANESHLDLRDAHGADDPGLFQVVLADGTGVAFAAHVTLDGFDLGVANKPQILNVKLEIIETLSWSDPD